MGPAPIRRDPWPFVGLACGLAFMLLAALVVRQGGLAFDEPLASAVRALPIPVAIWEACTFLGGTVLVLIGAVLVLSALASGRARLAIILGIALVVAALFTDLVKDYVARPRPPDPLVVATGFSFPSGHSLNSAATYGLVALVAWRARLLPAGRGLPVTLVRLAVIAGVTVPVLVGLSRIGLGVHWPTDVLGGWLAGIALVAVAATLITATGAMERDVPRRVRATVVAMPLGSGSPDATGAAEADGSPGASEAGSPGGAEAGSPGASEMAER